eukprot:3960363-Alexandrium_andersonii.AAC.1
MSASLVGSEMCIRDRHPCVRAGAPREHVLMHIRARMYMQVHVRVLCAVSYTHLTLPTICSV